LASKGDGLNRTACLCEATSILSPLMCIQWLILAPVVGYVWTDQHIRYIAAMLLPN
jgi:hypothetical protein